MLCFEETLNRAIFLIKEQENKIKSLASKLFDSTNRIHKLSLPDKELFIPIKEQRLSAKVAGVDSGFTNLSLSTLEIVLIRAIAAVFTYKNNSLERAEYLPKAIPLPEPIICTKAMQNEDISVNKSLLRLTKEANLACDTIKQFRPDFCFLDGSIVPQSADKPGKNSCLKPLYEKTLSLFQELYECSLSYEVLLVACVEDSKGTMLQDTLELHSEEPVYDTTLLSYIMEEGERTFAFPYSKNPSKHPVLKDIKKEFCEKIFVFYIRPSKHDVPLRVEILANSKENLSSCVENAASIAYLLSKGHREYSYPSVLLEADLHARLKPEEVQAVIDRLFCKIRPNVLGLRRNRRPFD
ncbi:MAG: DNA double-strand break repair nuclease NurA [Candidatus Diapherotrites archaeon]|nr:DNA double-strand break repair nuclease NurA [Candidatus Diapherotrites archaeon]